VKREVITKLLDHGLYPYTKRYLGTFNNHFSTIGLVGMNEVGLNAAWLKKDLTHKETQEFAKEVLNHMRNRLSDYQEQYGDLYNLEATPAESTSYRLAKHDTERYPDIITANMSGTPYYTNSSHLPVGYTDDIFTALDIQDELQTLYTSGTVFHAFLGERLSDWKSAAMLVRKIAENYRLPYYTMSPTYSICKNDGYLSGEVWKCPKCGAETEVYSRITGYYRPVKNWNAGKAQEFKDRNTYKVMNSSPKAGELRKMEEQESEPVSVEDDSKVSWLKADAEMPAAGRDVKPAEENTAAAGLPIMYVKDHCPKCKGAEQRFKIAKVEFETVNCSENLDIARELGITQTPTIIDPNGVRYVGETAAIEWIKAHKSLS
jgi:ribonucleoside-triphosphate reductase